MYRCMDTDAPQPQPPCFRFQALCSNRGATAPPQPSPGSPALALGKGRFLRKGKDKAKH